MSWNTYYGAFSALQRSNWIEPDTARPMRPIEWHVRGQLERGPGFAVTIICTLATTAGVIALQWGTTRLNRPLDLPAEQGAT